MIKMTGESRLELINFLCSASNATSYLEIGCNTDEVFANVNCPHKIGVDPASGGTHRMTSDEFFEQNTETFDVIFIDGLHYYDQVKKDYVNSMRFLKQNGFIAFHDMLPFQERWTVVPVPENLKEYGCWTGDVWRMSFDLIQESEIQFNLLMMDMGCGVVTRKSQQPKIVFPENSWKFYTNNFHLLPLTAYDQFVKMYS